MKELVEKIILGWLEGTSFFLLDLKVRGNRIEVILDGDTGINIKDCSLLNRHLHRRLEESGVDIEKITVEVSSPGFDRALGSLREYKKNTGRKLLIRTNQNKQLKGTLVFVDNEQIMLLPPSRKKPEILTYAQITEAKVTI